MTRQRGVRAVVGLALLAACGACRSGSPAASLPAAIELRAHDGRVLGSVPRPDLSTTERPVREQLERQYDALAAAAGGGASDAALGNACGEMGRLFLAAQFLDAAQASFAAASTLVPDEPRWAYYLGQVQRQKGAWNQAVSSFERVLQLRPGDEATLLWLGRVHLDLGQVEAGRQAYAAALAADPGSPPALAGLGRAALAARQYADAVKDFEQALAKRPGASVLQYSLAMAYRGLGDTERAEQHLKLRGTVEVSQPDPLMDALADLLESPLTYQRRGMEALSRRQWSQAASLFQHGIDLANGDPEMQALLREKLGTATFFGGDLQGAVDEFQQGIQQAPAFAQNYYSLAIVLATAGRDAEAIAALRGAVQHSPDYMEAHLALGDALRRTGKLEDSLTQYAEVLRIDPRVADARFGTAMALLKLGRYRDSAARLEDAMTRHPDDARFPDALARVLSTAPEAEVRDGRRALALTEAVERAHGMSAELAETRAMALAEMGRWADAVGWQQRVVAAMRDGGDGGATREAERLLGLYQRHEPNRVPWPDDDPVFNPGRAGSQASAPVGVASK